LSLCYVSQFLWLFQLLSKKQNEVNSNGLSAEPYLLNVDNMMACVTVGQQQITEAEALHVLASRCMELHR